MTDMTIPDRLSIDPRSPHFGGELLDRGLGIKINGNEKINVQEYCISEGWILLAVGKSLDRNGNPLTMKIKGTVEVRLLDEA
ncbi:MAG: DUF3297 family protein [Hyphomonadaceae bacterium]